MTWSGEQEFTSAIDRVISAADAAAREVVQTAAALLTREAQANFSGAHARGKPHVGGSKPNVVSGDLRRSIRPDPVVKRGDGDYATKVAPHMRYGRRVELGFKGSRKFPYFQPAVDKVAGGMQTTAVAVWKKHMSRI